MLRAMQRGLVCSFGGCRVGRLLVVPKHGNHSLWHYLIAEVSYQTTIREFGRKPAVLMPRSKNIEMNEVGKHE